ncbi:MAG TPA: alkaline phosphatase family protein, partial [Acidobacteriaceae bacterium]|nr:alkaline phosphatase family protein [Acidobacteriaceae bacterium]
MFRLNPFSGPGLATFLVLAACGCGGSGSKTSTSSGPSNIQLTVQVTGPGTVTSSPAGINCGQTCAASFASGTAVTLTAVPSSGSTFSGWSGGCSGTGACTVNLTAATSVAATFTASVQLTVQTSGTGTGTVTSSPAGINCGQTCTASFPSGTSVALTAAAASGSTFAGWSGGCSGTGACTVALSANATVTATFNAAGISSINHIVYLVQENRSFDNYFGALRQYWQLNGYADESFDGLPQFNPSSGTAPLYGPPPTNPGCDPTSPPPADCTFDTANPVTSYHLLTECTENTSPSWNESHVDWNYGDQLGLYPAKLNGYVWVAGHDARYNQPPYYDTNGIRAMGYYDGTDLNYY